MAINPSKPNNDLPFLPIKADIETKTVLKQAIKSNIELAKLNGFCSLLPNDQILLSTIILKEATASSEIENIITTQDKIYEALTVKNKDIDPETKEVLDYRSAVQVGFEKISENGILSLNTILKIQEKLEGNSAGIRKLPGTSLVNDLTGEVIYTPPDSEITIRNLMGNFTKYLNQNDNLDDLVRMAIIHYQFESIHPFYDGNGRTGRIINILYLVVKGLLNSPILFLSSYIIKNKNTYYKLLQEIRTKNNWEDWILFMLTAVEITSKNTLTLIQSILELLDETIVFCKKNLAKTSYSKELIELLFIQPYTKTEYLVNAGIGERRTSGKYLKQLEEIGVLESVQFWKEKIYINKKLVDIIRKEPT